METAASLYCLTNRFQAPERASQVATGRELEATGQGFREYTVAEPVPQR